MKLKFQYNQNSDAIETRMKSKLQLNQNFNEINNSK